MDVSAEGRGKERGGGGAKGEGEKGSRLMSIADERLSPPSSLSHDVLRVLRPTSSSPSLARVTSPVGHAINTGQVSTSSLGAQMIISLRSYFLTWDEFPSLSSNCKGQSKAAYNRGLAMVPCLSWGTSLPGSSDDSGAHHEQVTVSHGGRVTCMQ